MTKGWKRLVRATTLKSQLLRSCIVSMSIASLFVFDDLSREPYYGRLKSFSIAFYLVKCPQIQRSRQYPNHITLWGYSNDRKSAPRLVLTFLLKALKPA